MTDNQTINFKDLLYVTTWLNTALEKEKEKYEQCPVMPDMLPGYIDAQAWGYVVIGYFLVEESLKTLLYIREKKVLKEHSLFNLFDLLDGRDKDVLCEFYTDYRASIGGRLGNFQFVSLDKFLLNLDGDKNQSGFRIGSFDWRYFLIEEKRSREMPFVSVEYLHEIVFGCIKLINFAMDGYFEPSEFTHSWRMRSERMSKYDAWLNARMVSPGWDALGDRVEILWGPDYRGRHDIFVFRGKTIDDRFSEIPDGVGFPIVDKRKEIMSMDATKDIKAPVFTDKIGN